MHVFFPEEKLIFQNSNSKNLKTEKKLFQNQETNKFNRVKVEFD